MAEESARSRFLSKSKWGKVFKENDSPSAQGAFQLNDDVADFLKPSTDAAKEKQASIRAHLAPKLDIALAKRSPDAQTVRLAEQATSMRAEDVPMYYAKPRRRQGLMVGFVKTVPDVIGEGGDEAPDPPSEISRRKMRVARSTSDRRPSAQGDHLQWPETSSRPAVPQLQAGRGAGSELDVAEFTAPMLRRAQTSHNEVSPELGRKNMGPPLQPRAQSKPVLSRTPTGFSTQHEVDSPDGAQSPPQVPTIHPSIDIRSRALDQPDVRYDSAVPRPRLDVATGVASLRAPSKEPVSPVMLKHRDMSAGEGAILRRASALFMENDGETGTPRDPNSGIQPSAGYYDRLMDMTSGFSPPETASFREIGNVASKQPSPFEDPRYTEKHSYDKSNKSMSDPERGGQVRTHQSMRPPQQSSSSSSNSPFASLQESQTLPSRPYQEQHPPSHGQLDPRHPEAQRLRVSPMSQHHDQQRSRLGEFSGTDFSPGQERREPLSRGTRYADDSGLSHRQSPAKSQITSAPSYDYERGNVKQTGTEERLGRPQARDTSTHRNAPDAGGEPNFVPYSASSQQPATGLRKAPVPYLNGANANANPKLSPQPQSFVHKSASFADTPGHSPSTQHSRLPPTDHRYEQNLRASPAGSDHSAHRPAASPRSPAYNDKDAQLAWADFGSRVAHMKGVFRLTAEKERPAAQCDASAWLRAALWWYSIGKAGLEVLFHQRAKGARELLTQPHVDLAKAWWIVTDVLQSFNVDSEISSPSEQRNSSPESVMKTAVVLLGTHLQSLALSMTKNSLLPPHQSLIQGQDTKIWLQYPKFSPSDMVALRGETRVPSSTTTVPVATLSPIDVLPPGDSRLDLCYGRFVVDAFLSTDDAETDRVALPCILSMMRSKRDFQAGVVITTQTELIQLKILPRQPEGHGLTWRDVSWSANTHSLHVRLPRGLDLTVRMRESDFRAVWNLVEHSRKIEHTLRSEPDERLVHEVRLEELQYADSTNTNGFPQDKIRGCIARLFERYIEHRDGAGVRKMHRGFRLLLATDPGHKSLHTTSNELGRNAPLQFEFLTDAAANGTTAIIIRVQESRRQCRVLLVFRDMGSRQAFYNALNGLSVGSHETIVTRATLTRLNIELASQATKSAASSHPALQALQWQKLGVTNSMTNDPHSVVPDTVGSESLRIVARHAAGCITDRLNFGKGDMMLRLPCTDEPAIQLLRAPQDDLTVSIDTHGVQSAVSDGLAELYQLACQQLTVRTFTFAGRADLHAFQTAITGWSVLYDGMASTFGISRRRMVVPIYHKWTAADVRLQIVAQDTVIKVVAFMEGFSHADAMLIQVKSMDVFETIKGDGKGKKWALKMVDAKFSLPTREERKEKESPSTDSDAHTVQRRFVNLEGLEYAGEHDDITIGFDTEDGESRPLFGFLQLVSLLDLFESLLALVYALTSRLTCPSPRPIRQGPSRAHDGRTTDDVEEKNLVSGRNNFIIHRCCAGSSLIHYGR
nr:hypothetical protein CFP56_66848 [Quercus suber]